MIVKILKSHNVKYVIGQEKNLSLTGHNVAGSMSVDGVLLRCDSGGKSMVAHVCSDLCKLCHHRKIMCSGTRCPMKKYKKDATTTIYAGVRERKAVSYARKNIV